MAIHLKCVEKCGSEIWAANIVELLTHRDQRGYFICPCGHSGYVEKSFALQEAGEVWEPFLRGAISLGEQGSTYQPFVYLVSYEPDGPVNDLWFAYYKDTRSAGGRLKLGYGPGGPPALGATDLVTLMVKLIEIGVLSRSQIEIAITQCR